MTHYAPVSYSHAAKVFLLLLAALIYTKNKTTCAYENYQYLFMTITKQLHVHNESSGMAMIVLFVEQITLLHRCMHTILQNIRKV